MSRNGEGVAGSQPLKSRLVPGILGILLLATGLVFTMLVSRGKGGGAASSVDPLPAPFSADVRELRGGDNSSQGEARLEALAPKLLDVDGAVLDGYELRIVEESSRAVISGALVSGTLEGVPFSLTAGHDGLVSVPRTVLSLSVSAKGYIPRRVERGALRQVLRGAIVDVVLTPRASLRIHVVDRSGQPVEGAFVNVFVNEMGPEAVRKGAALPLFARSSAMAALERGEALILEDGRTPRARPGNLLRSSTNDFGEFVVGGLPCFAKLMVVISDACVTQSRNIRLRPGPVDERLEFVVDRGFALSGRFLVGGNPLPDAAFELRSATLGRTNHNAGPDGAFRIGGIPGSVVTLAPRWPGFEPMRVSVEVDTDLGDINMDIPGRAVGQVVSRYPIPKEGYLVQLDTPGAVSGASGVSSGGRFSVTGRVQGAEVLLVDVQSPDYWSVLDRQGPGPGGEIYFFLDELTGALSGDSELLQSVGGERGGSIKVCHLSGALARDVQFDGDPLGGVIVPHLQAGEYRVVLASSGGRRLVWDRVNVVAGEEVALSRDATVQASLAVTWVGPGAEGSMLTVCVEDSSGSVYRSAIPPSRRALLGDLSPGGFSVWALGPDGKVLAKISGSATAGENAIELGPAGGCALRLVLDGPAGRGGVKPVLAHVGLGGRGVGPIPADGFDVGVVDWSELCPGSYLLAVEPAADVGGPAFMKRFDLGLNEALEIVMPDRAKATYVRFRHQDGSEPILRSVRALSLLDGGGVLSAQLRQAPDGEWGGVPPGGQVLFFCAPEEQPRDSLFSRSALGVFVGILERDNGYSGDATVVLGGATLVTSGDGPTLSGAPPSLEIVGFEEIDLARTMGATFLLSSTIADGQVRWPFVPAGLRVKLVDPFARSPSSSRVLTVTGDASVALDR